MEEGGSVGICRPLCLPAERFLWGEPSHQSEDAETPMPSGASGKLSRVAFLSLFVMLPCGCCDNAWGEYNIAGLRHSHCRSVWSR